MRIYTQMHCKNTGQLEDQLVVRESEDGIYLKCAGCDKVQGYEIGFFAHKYQSYTEKAKKNG